MKILFICAANLNRSPTLESYFKKHFPKYEVRSAGIYYGYPYQVDEFILDWADKIYVVDISQEKYINEHFPLFLNKIEIIGISDQYDRDSPELISLIDYWVKKNHNFKKFI